MLRLLLENKLDPNKKYGRIDLRDKDGKYIGHSYNVPLWVPSLLRENKQNIIALLTYGAICDENSTYKYKESYGDSPTKTQHFNEKQKRLLQEASAQVKRKKIAPLTTITKGNTSVFPNGVAQNIASYLNSKELACAASICKSPEKK